MVPLPHLINSFPRILKKQTDLAVPFYTITHGDCSFTSKHATKNEKPKKNDSQQTQLSFLWSEEFVLYSHASHFSSHLLYFLNTF